MSNQVDVPVKTVRLAMVLRSARAIRPEDESASPGIGDLGQETNRFWIASTTVSDMVIIVEEQTSTDNEFVESSILAELTEGETKERDDSFLKDVS
jgi:hypothetical protein